MTTLYCYHEKGLFYLILFGLILSFQDLNILGLRFSERKGYKKILRVGHWAIRLRRSL